MMNTKYGRVSVLALAVVAASCDGGSNDSAADDDRDPSAKSGRDAAAGGSANEAESDADDDRDGDSSRDAGAADQAAGSGADDAEADGTEADDAEADDAEADDAEPNEGDVSDDPGNPGGSSADAGDSAVDLGATASDTPAQVSEAAGHDQLVGLASIQDGYVIVYNRDTGTREQPDVWAFARLWGSDGQARGEEFAIADRTDGKTSYATSVSSSPDGGFVISWAEGIVGPTVSPLQVIYEALHVEHFDAEGVRGREMVIAQSPNDGGPSAKTAVLDDGRAVVTWINGLSMSVLAQVEGTEEPFVVDVESEEEALASRGPVAHADIAVSDGDELLFAWVVRDALGEELQGDDVFARGYLADGTPTTAERKVSTTDHLTEIDSLTLREFSEGFVVGWVTWTSSYFQTIDAAASKRGDEMRVGTVAEPDAAFVTAFAPLSAGFVMSWFDNVSGVRQDGFVQAFSADGTPVTGYESFSTPDDFADDHGLVTALSDGETLALAWSAAPDDTADTPEQSVFTRLLAAPTAPVPADDPGDDQTSDNTDASSLEGASCEAFDACGGDPTGSWRVVGVCFESGPVGTCADSIVSGTGTADGQFEQSETDYRLLLELTAELHFNVPTSCLDGSSCDEAFASFASGPDDRVETEDLGDICDATVVQSATTETETESSIDGATIARPSGGGMEFCQQGDGLALRQVSNNPFGAVLLLERDE